MSAGSDHPAEPIAWDEAREVVSIVLLAAALMVVVAPAVRHLADGNSFGASDTISSLLTGIGPVSGGLLVGSALLIATTPAEDVVPALRLSVALISAVVAAGGMVALLIEATSVTAAHSAGYLIRLSTMSTRSLPGAMLAGLAAWLARNVVPFPKR